MDSRSAALVMGLGLGYFSLEGYAYKTLHFCQFLFKIFLCFILWYCRSTIFKCCLTSAILFIDPEIICFRVKMPVWLEIKKKWPNRCPDR